MNSIAKKEPKIEASTCSALTPRITIIYMKPIKPHPIVETIRVVMMTCFENFFASLKRALGRSDFYDIWPEFEPVYDENEFTITTIQRLGEVLLLNCGSCDGPSDTRHPKCSNCVHRRVQYGIEAYQKSTGRNKSVWSTIFLTRVIQFKPAIAVAANEKQ